MALVSIHFRTINNCGQPQIKSISFIHLHGVPMYVFQKVVFEYYFSHTT